MSLEGVFGIGRSSFGRRGGVGEDVCDFWDGWRVGDACGSVWPWLDSELSARGGGKGEIDMQVTEAVWARKTRKGWNTGS